MNELIKIDLNENKEPVVSGRELHKVLEIKTPYKKWFDRMVEYGFEENIDYIIFGQKSSKIEGRGRPGINHAITLDMAKELAMTQNNEIGRQMRKYFIESEKQLKQLLNNKQIFNRIENQPTTPYRVMISNQMLNNGLLEADVETRCYNVKLTKALNDLIIELGYGGYIPHIQKEIGKAIYRMYPQEWSELHNITNPHRRRDYCTVDQWTVTQFVEKELYKMLIHHEGDIGKRQLFRYVDDCTQRGLGLWELIQENEEIKNHICSNQSSLDEYIVITG